jgi:hypothetical protein
MQLSNTKRVAFTRRKQRGKLVFVTVIISLLLLRSGSEQLIYRPDATTQADKRNITRLIIKEANDVAAALSLADSLPLKESDTREVFISPPRFANDLGALGNIKTLNYRYCVSQGWKLSYIIKLNQESGIQNWEKSYCCPASELNGYGAYQLATQWLALASMDVKGLNASYPWVVEAEHFWSKTNAFLPLFTVRWKRGDAWERNVASVSLFLPTRTLVELRVEDAKFILRKPLM